MVKHFFEWDWDGARAAYSRAIELNPRNAIAHSWYAYLCALFNEDQTIALSARAVELEPFAPYVASTAGYAAHMVRRYELARRRLDRALELHPDYVLASWMRSMVGLFLSEGAESVARLERVVNTAGRVPLYLGFLGGAYGRTGRMTQAPRQIADELEAMRKVRYIQPMAFVWVYSGLGDRESTLTYLEQAYTERDLLLITVDSQIDFVRDDPRFDKILMQMKLPTSHRE
jgi:tetratricopeptide (TPR) repeat protein